MKPHTHGFLSAKALAANIKQPRYGQVGLLGIEGAVNKEWDDREGFVSIFGNLNDFIASTNAITPKSERVKLPKLTRIEPLGRAYEIQAPPSLAQLDAIQHRGTLGTDKKATRVAG